MSATKRRAGAASSPDMSTPAPKRKRNDDTNFPDPETTETTSELGLKLVSQLKRAQDKNGRNVGGHFLDLPSKDEYPDYYQQIAMPLTLNMIEARLEDGDYHTMKALEGDLKRMVQNAKDYNDSRSEVFADAERIRKALSNFMPKHNPAYLDPEYRAVPTAIPQALLDKLRESSVSTAATGGPEKVRLVIKRGPSQVPSNESAVDAKDAQLELLQELSEHEFGPNFERKPPKREYPEYYKQIHRPTSISDVRTMVNQEKIKEWNEFAREVRLIWDNAKEFNEPSSAIYEMTESIEAWFEERVQASGAGPRPKPPRLSLTQPKRTQLKLTLGSATPTHLAGGTIDNESLRRQKEEMGQALNHANRANSRSAVPSTPAGPPSTTTSMRRSLSTVEPNDGGTSGMNGRATPQMVNAHEAIRGSIPPLRQLPTPVMNGEPPAPFIAAPAVGGSRYPEVFYHAPPTRNIYAEPDNPIDRKFRDAGKGEYLIFAEDLGANTFHTGLEDALLSSVTYMTHPNLPGDPKWKLTRHASATKTQTSSYVYLPSDHFYLRLQPSLTSELRARRNHKLCVSVNWQLVAPSQQVPGVYDFRLQPGENTIIVDVIADLKDGDRKEYAPPQMQFDFERITLVALLVERALE